VSEQLHTDQASRSVHVAVLCEAANTCFKLLTDHRRWDERQYAFYPLSCPICGSLLYVFVSCEWGGHRTRQKRVLKCAANLIEVFPKWHRLCQYVYGVVLWVYGVRKKWPNNAFISGEVERHVGVHGLGAWCLVLGACTEHELKQNIRNAVMGYDWIWRILDFTHCYIGVNMSLNVVPCDGVICILK